MNSLGIDYNTWSVCWSVHDDKFKLLSYAEVRDDSLKGLLTKFSTALDEMPVLLQRMAIEKIYIGMNALTVQRLALVQGGCVWECLRRNIVVTQVPVPTWKAQMLKDHGGARASKQQAIEVCLQLMKDSGWEGSTDELKKNDNLCDAILIGSYLARQPWEVTP
jgi:Holliday junction resolvasome RuvABC endonuclease subunit